MNRSQDAGDNNSSTMASLRITQAYDAGVEAGSWSGFRAGCIVGIVFTVCVGLALWGWLR